MKKIISLAVIMVLIFVLSGCSSDESSNNTKSNDTGSAVNNSNDTKDTKDTNSTNSEPQKDATKNDSSTNEIQMSWFENPPHIFMDKQSGKLTGAVYDLIEEKIAPKMNVKFIWDKEATAIPRQTATFEANNKAFASALLTKSPDREKISICSGKTYFKSQTAIALKKDNPLNEIKKIDDVLNLKIGYAEKSFISPFMKDPRVKFDLVSAGNYHETNLKKLTAGRLDAAYAPDKAAFLGVIKQLNLENDIKILDIPEDKANFYVVFSKSASSIADKYNEVTNSMDLEKEYLNLLSKYIDISKL